MLLSGFSRRIFSYGCISRIFLSVGLPLASIQELRPFHSEGPRNAREDSWVSISNVGKYGMLTGRFINHIVFNVIMRKCTQLPHIDGGAGGDSLFFTHVTCLQSPRPGHMGITRSPLSKPLIRL